MLRAASIVEAAFSFSGGWHEALCETALGYQGKEACDGCHALHGRELEDAVGNGSFRARLQRQHPLGDTPWI